jgi:hypothetical protein
MPPLYSYFGLSPINGFNIRNPSHKNYDQLLVNSTGRVLIGEQQILATMTPQFI